MPVLNIYFSAEDLGRVRVAAAPDPAWEMLPSLQHHHCVVVDERGERLLSRRVFNDEPALLELITDVLALSEDALWAVDINHGGAALLIGLLLSREQPMVYITGLAVHQASTPTAARARRTRRMRSSSPTRHACARTSVSCGPATR